MDVAVHIINYLVYERTYSHRVRSRNKHTIFCVCFETVHSISKEQLAAKYYHVC